MLTYTNKTILSKVCELILFKQKFYHTLMYQISIGMSETYILKCCFFWSYYTRNVIYLKDGLHFRVMWQLIILLLPVCNVIRLSGGMFPTVQWYLVESHSGIVLIELQTIVFRYDYVGPLMYKWWWLVICSCLNKKDHCQFR